jgi:rRNA maturation protein Rpf1
MTVVAFDTLKFANRLKEAGVPDKHAEAEAEALAEVFEVNLKELATKRDLQDLAESTRRDLKDLETRLRAEIELVRRDLRELGQQLTIRLGAMLAVAVAVVTGLVKLL